MSIYWMSFADAELPKGEQFLGVVILDALNEADACVRSHMLGLNPGGEIQLLEVPDDLAPDREWFNRLLDRAEAEALNAIMSARH